ncbi:MAG: hypothetical protein MZV70_77000 [Desulfobacterales bacterium]|nr:hypothetical protein [Desulfobacterales bacterium]
MILKKNLLAQWGELLCYADKADKLTAIRMKCGSEFGNRTQRLIKTANPQKETRRRIYGLAAMKNMKPDALLYRNQGFFSKVACMEALKQ